MFVQELWTPLKKSFARPTHSPYRGGYFRKYRTLNYKFVFILSGDLRKVTNDTDQATLSTFTSFSIKLQTHQSHHIN